MADRKTLGQLFVPIFFETLFFMIMGSVDTLMLSAVGDEKVGAVGAANTYLGLFTIAFSIISAGVLAVMTQYIGAKKEGVAKQALYFGLILNGGLGLTLSLILFFLSRPILQVLGVAPALLEYAITYMEIVGVSSVFTALSPIFSSYLRAFGFAKESLIANIIANVVNVGLNALFIYVWHLDVLGVALATLISRVVALIITFLFAILRIHLPKDSEKISNGLVSWSIFRIGFPSALETLLYNVAMALVMKSLNKMSDDGIYVTIRSYASQISNFSYCAGAALASANAIRVGWKIGEGRMEECQKDTFRVMRIGLLSSLPMAVAIAGLSPLIMRLFTRDEQIIHMVMLCMWIDVALECGRTTNLIIGQALKTSGDAIFTVIVATVFMYLFAALGTWVFGLQLHWMVLGCFFSLALDEVSRGILMAIRWKSGAWKKKVLIQQNRQTKNP